MVRLYLFEHYLQRKYTLHILCTYDKSITLQVKSIEKIYMVTCVLVFVQIILINNFIVKLETINYSVSKNKMIWTNLFFLSNMNKSLNLNILTLYKSHILCFRSHNYSSLLSKLHLLTWTIKSSPTVFRWYSETDSYSTCSLAPQIQFKPHQASTNTISTNLQRY